MPYIERRGGSIRVKWWGGDYKLDADGRPTKKKIYESASGTEDGPFADEDEAYAYGLDRESDVRNGRHFRRSSGSTPMGVLCPQWLELQDLAWDSIRAYRTVVNAQILPEWSHWAVGDITVPAYDAWALRVRATRSRTYATGILAVFSMIMDYAVACGMRQTSPVVKVRRRGKYVPRKRERKTDLDLAVVHNLSMNANALWGYPGYVFFLTIAFTGMRRSEIFGLRREYSSPTWPASDPRPDPEEEGDRYKADMLRYGTGDGRMPALRVEYQHKYERGRPVLVMPKYGSRRTLVLPPFLAQMHEDLLKSHDSEWTFPSVMDGPLLYVDWSGRYYGPIARGREARGGRFPLPAVPAVPEWLVPDGKGGVKPRRMHLLRHGHKEWLDESGVARVAAEARMGHELPGVEGVYSHVTAPMEARIMEVLQERWETFVGTLGPDWQPPSPIRLPQG